MKFSSITVANLANSANPLPAEDPAPPLETINFKDDTAANLANSANRDAEISRISDFSNADTRENANFSAVRCADCWHGKPATATDSYSWHSCRAGLTGWWGMAPQRCEGWEGKP